MERIVYLLPTYGKITIVTKLAITKHFFGNIAEFGKKAKVPFEFFRYGFEKTAKNLRFSHTVGIIALSVDMTLSEKIWGD